MMSSCNENTNDGSLLRPPVQISIFGHNSIGAKTVTMHEQHLESIPLLLSFAQAAEQLNVCERTVWTLVHDGELPHIRVGRRVLISRTAIERWISAKEASGQ